jgi:putative ABC transport system permease protein
MGSNMLVVVPGNARGMRPSASGAALFSVGDLDAIARQAHDVAHLSAVGNQFARLVAGPYHRTSETAGVEPEYFQIRSWGVSAGRLLTNEDERQGASVCVIGQTVADALFPGQNPLGQQLRVQKTSCRIVGLMEAKGASAFGVDMDDTVFMPYSTFSKRLVGTDRVAVLFASAVAADRIESAKDQIGAVLRRRRHIASGDEDDFAIRDPREMQTLLESMTRLLTGLLAGVAAVSLVVGGIGIMNIMLVSVTERTREIGVRLAIGARASDILLQFLVEATTLSALGGAVGIAFGLSCAVVGARALHVPFVVATSSLPVSFGVSILVGVTFGLLPARKAARLSPLAALRYE